MQKIMFLSIMIYFLLGCSGSAYSLKRSNDDQFADKSGFNLITLDENHMEMRYPNDIIPKSQLLPYVYRDSAGNNIETGFRLINVISDLVNSNARWLNIRQGDEIIFLADGNRVASKARNVSIDHISSYDSLTKRTTTYYYDFASYKLSADQFRAVCNARNIKIKIFGQDGYDEYGTGKHGQNELLENFYKNNKRFFDEEILGRSTKNQDLTIRQNEYPLSGLTPDTEKKLSSSHATQEFSSKPAGAMAFEAESTAIKLGCTGNNGGRPVSSLLGVETNMEHYQISCSQGVLYIQCESGRCVRERNYRLNLLAYYLPQ
ncbi:MAG: hypothetical protein ACKN9T_08885 [Candidatus Methylumidiphilus sp.]